MLRRKSRRRSTSGRKRKTDSRDGGQGQKQRLQMTLVEFIKVYPELFLDLYRKLPRETRMQLDLMDPNYVVRAGKNGFEIGYATNTYAEWRVK